MPEIEGYKVLPLRVTADTKLEHCHSIYMREHFIRLMDPNKPRGRTLFMLNVPPYVTEQSLRDFFQASAGAVLTVAFALKPGRDEAEKWRQQTLTPFSNDTPPPFKFKVAYVVFKASTSVSRALELESLDLFNASSGESTIVSGLQLWHAQHQSRIMEDEAAAQAQIDAYMGEYDVRERERQAAAKNSEADADGWVTVGKQGRSAGFEQKESVIERLEEKMARGKKSRELTNFYTFQIRESKMKNIIDLRKRFEEDKKKIEVLKQTRRFRPF